MKLSQQNQDIAFKVGLVVAGYLLFAKPILNYLGITKGKGEHMADQNSQDPNSPLNTKFFEKYLYFKGENGTGKKIIMQSLWDRVKHSAMKLVDGFGYFTDNEDQIMSAIKDMKTKAEISLLSYYLSLYHKRDLIEFLRHGRDLLPENGLSNDELVQVFNYVNNLPVS